MKYVLYFLLAMFLFGCSYAGYTTTNKYAFENGLGEEILPMTYDYGIWLCA